MIRYITLILFIGLVWGQEYDPETGEVVKKQYEPETRELIKDQNDTDEIDKLVLKDGTTYFGEFSKIEGKIVYFKPQNAFAFQPISIKQVERLELKGGHAIILGGVTFEEYKKGSGCTNGTIILGVIIYYFKDWFIEAFEDAISF